MDIPLELINTFSFNILFLFVHFIIIFIIVSHNHLSNPLNQTQKKVSVLRDFPLHPPSSSSAPLLRGRGLSVSVFLSRRISILF